LVCLLPFGEVCLRVSQFSTAFLPSHLLSGLYNAWRWVPNPKPAFSEAQVQNLKALSAILDESEPNQRIIKAEIVRELGNFEKCLLLLSYQFDKGFDRAVGFIKKLAEEKDRAVKPFKSGK
jgi:hypothetical protein